MTKIPIKDLGGGFNLQESSTLKDNQFESLQNMSYNADGRLITRRGIKNFGNPVPSGKPQTSYFFYKNSTTGLRTAIISSGTDLYKYDEGTSAWVSIKSGLSEFEADGVTRTRWSFVVYLDKLYLCNGVDDYAEYDSATNTYTTIAGQPKARYLARIGLKIFGGGVDNNPHTLYASAAGAADGKTLNANDIDVGNELDGPINGIDELQQSVLVFKDKKIFNISGDLSSANALDAENGGYGERAIQRVGNSLIYFNDRGFNTLKTKNGITGVSAIQDTPLSDDIRALVSQVVPGEYNSSIGTYIPSLTNYYGSFDTGVGGTPDTTIVWSSLQQAWTRHLYPAHYSFGYYEKADGVIQYIITSATSNQVFEIESGFTDLGGAIDTEILSKKYDIGDPIDPKTFTAIDLQGLKSEGGEIEVELLVEGESVATSTITDDYMNITSSILTIGTQVIGTGVIGGGAIGQNDIDLYRYFIRIPIYEVGGNIQIKLKTSTAGLVHTLDRITIHADSESEDLFSYENIG